MARLVLSRNLKETIVIVTPLGERVDVTVVDVRNDRVRIAIDAPETIAVDRMEVMEKKSEVT
jgi:carbon storage regulator CsrA